MIFSSMIFIWIFLPFVFCGSAILHKLGSNKAANLLLLFMSILFYAWGEPVYVFLMLFSVTVNWSFGLLMVHFTSHKKFLLVINVIINLGLLGYFKYTGMIIDTINKILQTSFVVPEIALPIGISFFTFQALSYVIDVYRGECEAQKKWYKLALYISFFPQLIAGPIVKYKDINEQIDHRSIRVTQMASGIRRFIYGFSKKVLLANVFGLCADRIYGLKFANVTSSMAWLASITYTLQIYYDFSGYSDMAIGLGRMFGFDFKENFNYPYGSFSIKEFWRRWHISLSSWFRDYVYIPLGGNRKGRARTYINLFIVFLCTGLWHGASWTFVVWGLYHGTFCIIERLGFEKLLKKSKFFSFIYCIIVVNLGWVFFRCETIIDGLRYIKRMVLPLKFTVSNYSVWEFIDLYTVFMIVVGILGAGIIKNIGEKLSLDSKWRYSALEMVFCIGIFILSILSLAGNTYNPFIYFRF